MSDGMMSDTEQEVIREKWNHECDTEHEVIHE